MVPQQKHMAANIFKITGEKVDSQEAFLSLGQNGIWRNLLYYPETFGGAERQPLIFQQKSFIEVSFKDTDIKNVRFRNCVFTDCLLMGAAFIDCEFERCAFRGVNTSKLKIKRCYLDPEAFRENFDFKTDTNIAIGLYHALYRNASEEHQPLHAIESLYRMRYAEYRHLDSQKERGLIGKYKYTWKKFAYRVENFVSGYGLRPGRVLRLFFIVIPTFAIINHLLRSFTFKDWGSFSWVDSIYFTCVVVTTLGFGDITPVTPFGKMLIAGQTLIGLLVVTLFLAAVTNRTFRGR